jgi:hypothetical protein
MDEKVVVRNQNSYTVYVRDPDTDEEYILPPYSVEEVPSRVATSLPPGVYIIYGGGNNA